MIERLQGLLAQAVLARVQINYNGVQQLSEQKIVQYMHNRKCRHKRYSGTILASLLICGSIADAANAQEFWADALGGGQMTSSPMKQ